MSDYDDPRYWMARCYELEDRLRAGQELVEASHRALEVQLRQQGEIEQLQERIRKLEATPAGKKIKRQEAANGAVGG